MEGEAHHLLVRRAEDGESVELRDGEGLVGLGRLVRVGEALGRGRSYRRWSRAAPELTLAVGAGDRERFAWVVEKAAELGVTSVIPMESQRTEGVASRVRTQHLERLRRHALEAVKQSGAAWATRVEEPVSLGELAGRVLVGQGWVADASGASGPRRRRRGAADRGDRAGRGTRSGRAGAASPGGVHSGEPGPAHAAVRDGGDRRGGGGRCRATTEEPWLTACSAGSWPGDPGDDREAIGGGVRLSRHRARAPTHVLVIPTEHIAAVGTRRARTGSGCLGGC